jgi:hypothetical protein
MIQTGFSSLLAHAALTGKRSMRQRSIPPKEYRLLDKVNASQKSGADDLMQSGRIAL